MNERTEVNDRELCVCGHELRLHGLEADGTRGLCIRDEWCHCPGFQPQHSRQHELDEDACCIHCGFDAAEWWHLERQKPKADRESQPPCERRTGPTITEQAWAEMQGRWAEGIMEQIGDE